MTGPRPAPPHRVDMAATLALVAGGAFGMEMWARYAHKALWHDFTPGWALHKSHHEPRTGPFEVWRRRAWEPAAGAAVGMAWERFKPLMAFEYTAAWRPPSAFLCFFRPSS
jgi:hypothetical protein